MKSLLKFLLSIVLLTILSGNAAAHRYHTTLTRIDYNAQEKLAEVSIQLFTHDFERVLEKQTKKRVDFDKSAKTDALVIDYLKANFILKDKNGAVQKLVWVGKEFDADAMRVYIEIPLVEEPENYDLQNTVFFETFAEQTNLVTVRFDEKKADLLFKVGDRFKKIIPNVSAANEKK